MAGKISLSRTTIFLGLAVLALVLGGILIYVQVGVNRNLKEEAVTEQQLLNQAEATLARYQQLRDNAPLYRAQLAELKQMIPPQPAEEAIIRHIYFLAADADLRVTEIRFGNRSENKDYVEMPLAITMEGAFPGLLKTLMLLRSGTRAIRVDEINVTGRQSESGVRAVLTACAFYNKAEAEKAAETEH